MTMAQRGVVGRVLLLKTAYIVLKITAILNPLLSVARAKMIILLNHSALIRLMRQLLMGRYQKPNVKGAFI